MTESTSSTPTPTLPGDWTPTQQGCLKTGDFWMWDYGNGRDNRTVLGGPSQTVDCFPSATWGATETFLGSECPPQYTLACQGTDAAQAVTCCPTAYSFSCVAPTEVQTAPHGSAFRCVSAWASTGSVAVTHTDLVGGGGINLGTVTMGTLLHLFALQMIYVTEVIKCKSFFDKFYAKGFPLVRQEIIY